MRRKLGVTMLVEPAATTSSLTPRALPTLPGDSSRFEAIRIALTERLTELAGECRAALTGLESNATADAGDDVADLGTKAFAREQEYALIGAIKGRISQVERALQRLAEGRYGWCERCAQEIPVARLTAFPAVTLCVNCKRAEERG